MKKIYILLMHTNTRPSQFVKLMTGYEYSHVAISLDKQCDVIYSFGRKKLHSILDGGFSIERKNGEFFKRFDKTKCKIYELEVDETQYAEVEKIIEDMKDNINMYKYDFIGIALRFFYIPITFKNRYVCSYFIAHLLEKAQIYNFDKQTCFMKPKDFENLVGLNPIYTGQYCLYQ